MPIRTASRVLLINGSPRHDGFTAQMISAFQQALAPYVEVEQFDCFDTPPLPCNDCRACFRVSACIRPDLQDFYTSLELADVLIIATPVYNLSFPAPLKALIDRMQVYWSARFKRGIRPPIAKSKRTALFTVAGTDSLEGGIMLEKQLRPVLTVTNGTLTHTVHYCGSDIPLPLGPSLDLIRKAAADLFNS